MKVAIGIVDDHKLFLSSLKMLITTFKEYEVVLESFNGKDMVHKIEQKKAKPDIMLVDIDMPEMNGEETVRWLQKKYPNIKCVALTMKEDDYSIIRMIRAGCCSYLLKDINVIEFENALKEINQKGYYNADAANISYRRLIIADSELKNINLSEKEIKFLEHVCSELTYKEIAHKMNITIRAADRLRELMFDKFNVQSRVGLVIDAIRKNIISV